MWNQQVTVTVWINCWSFQTSGCVKQWVTVSKTRPRTKLQCYLKCHKNIVSTQPGENQKPRWVSNFLFACGNSCNTSSVRRYLPWFTRAAARMYKVWPMRLEIMKIMHNCWVRGKHHFVFKCWTVRLGRLCGNRTNLKMWLLWLNGKRDFLPRMQHTADLDRQRKKNRLYWGAWLIARLQSVCKNV